MTKSHRAFVNFEEAEEDRVICMANMFLHTIGISGEGKPAVMASALGYALAVVMSRTDQPEKIFSAALNARDVQYRELSNQDKSIEYIYHH